MTRLQKLLLRQSEIRERLNELLEVEERSDEQNGELRSLTTEGRELEPEIRAAMVAEPEPETRTEPNTGDAEEREREELRSQFSVGRFIAWRAGKADLNGPTAEYMAAVESDGKLPSDVFEARSDEAPERETRAVTPGQQGGANQRPIVPAVFKRSVAPFLGITMPNAGMGDVVFPVLSTVPGSGVGPVAKGAAVNAAAGAFTVSSQQPRRIGAQFTVRYEDLARLEGMEMALRSAIQGAVGEELDDQIINGAAAAYNTDGEIRGLLAQLTDPPNPATGLETWARWHTAAVSHLADPWAVTERDIRLLVGTVSYRQAAGLFRATESNESFPAYWNRVGGGMRLSGKIAAPASNIQQAIVARANPANDQAAVMPHWASFDLTVRDIYTEANKGQVSITVHMLVGDVVLLRSDVFVQDSFRVTS